MIAQLIVTVAGLWLMFAPWALGYDGAPAVSDRIAGPTMASIAFLAIFSITRGVRWLNLPVGAWLLVAPWLLGFPTDAAISSMASGLLAVLLTPLGTPDQARYGGGWRALVQTDRLVWPDDT